jgi:hypothetical protein
VNSVAYCKVMLLELEPQIGLRVAPHRNQPKEQKLFIKFLELVVLSARTEFTLLYESIMIGGYPSVLTMHRFKSTVLAVL